MAKVILGSMVGQASGRLASIVFSHNRGGQYVRNGVIPVVSTTSFALAAKARLATVSQNWQSLTDAQRLSWSNFALSNPRSDKLRQSQILTGHAAYVALNTRRLLVDQELLDTPPITAAPNGLTTLTLTADIGEGDVEIAFTETPLAADTRIWIQAARVDSQGIRYVHNLLRFAGVSDTAPSSPLDIQSEVEARIGALSVGQRLTVLASVYDDNTGLLSSPLRADATVVSSSP